MSGQSAGTNPVVNRYVRALITASDEAAVIEKVAHDLQALGELLKKSSEFRVVCQSPLLAKPLQFSLIEQVVSFLELSPLVERFLKVLVRNRRLAFLDSMVTCFATQLSERRGEKSVEITTSVGYAQADKQRFEQELIGRLSTDGLGKVKFTWHVNPALLQGLTLKTGSLLVDASLQHRLQLLEQRMKGAA
ncbi:MAG: ATP synthase F1 subunit delta [Alphaproteobacteria bacterium]